MIELMLLSIQVIKIYQEIIGHLTGMCFSSCTHDFATFKDRITKSPSDGFLNILKNLLCNKILPVDCIDVVYVSDKIYKKKLFDV